MKAVDSELRLRRLTVDEALSLLEQYLYDAYMAGLPSVRVVHGKGTGKLRLAVHRRLANHPSDLRGRQKNNLPICDRKQA